MRGSIAVVVLLAAGLAVRAQYADRDSRPVPPTSAKAPASGARIDINHASVNELMKAPGLKRPWAERIVRYRPYRSKLDLVDRGIVTGEVYERIKDFVIAHRD
jgi:DNA uptake protein ComE-like DNA-binding protein